MKRKLIAGLLALMLVVPSLLKAEFYDSIYEAQKQALQEAKLMVFFVVSDTCPHCHKLMNHIYGNQTLLRYLDENFVVAVANLNAGGLIPKNLVFNQVTPTTYILTPTGTVIGQPIEGAIDSNYLFELLKGLREYQRGRLGF